MTDEPLVTTDIPDAQAGHVESLLVEPAPTTAPDVATRPDSPDPQPAPKSAPESVTEDGFLHEVEADLRELVARVEAAEHRLADVIVSRLRSALEVVRSAL